MNSIKIKNRIICGNSPVYIIAEMSANHSGSLQTAKDIIYAAKEAGADCIKVQTYTPDTLTLNCNNEHFRIRGGLWNGQTLYNLYSKAYMPWEWQAELKTEADKIGIDFFSTPFDSTSMDFLESIGIEFYKIASFEIVDIPLIKKVAATQKPVIMSTGMATKEEIQEAVDTVYLTGNKQLALLKCSSAYPAHSKDMNLFTISDFAKSFGTVVGLSDHSTENLSSIVAVAMGAKIIEKHFCITRQSDSVDSAFSLDKVEFKNLVIQIRETEQVLGEVSYGPAHSEKASLKFRKSIFSARNIKKGELFSTENIRVIRPSLGMHPRNYENLLGKRALRGILSGSPISEDMIDGF